MRDPTSNEVPARVHSRPAGWASVVWRTVLPVAVTIVVAIFLYGPKGLLSARSSKKSDDGVTRIAIATKDSNFDVVPPSRGGASGSVWFRSRAPALALQLRAAGLVPSHRFQLELSTDQAVYTVARLSSDAQGRLSFDTTLTQLANDRCVVANRVPTRPLQGRIKIKFWVRRDWSPTVAGSPCSGNGDGDSTYSLLEEDVGTFYGTH
ncbi:MAG TPA: hypothetical protein VN717_07150 [Gemmatimonadaceae bacterium]|nr:hypothetical protein [Gemmatimonadaceae bacterium]